jgi:uncharacterized protein
MSTEKTFPENVNPETTKLSVDSGTLLQPVDQSKRIVILDVLRGFALLGILMVNMQYFSVPFSLATGEARLWTGPVNTGAYWFIDFFFHGKFYVLFSFLFGLGFFLFLRKADETGRAVISIFRRRLLALFMFGVLHVLLIWYADILVFYALFGFILVWFRRKSNRAVLIWAGVFMLLPTFFAALMTGFINLMLSIPEAAGEIQAAFAEQETQVRELTQQALITYSTGSFLDIIPMRLTEYTFNLGGLLFFYPGVLGMFLVGMLFGRKGYLSDIGKNREFFKKLLLVSLPVALIANFFLAQSIPRGSYTILNLDTIIMNAGFAFGGPSMAFVYIALIALCIHRGWFSWLSEKIAVTGRMALTNYLTQSIIATTIFYGYGLGWYGQVNVWQGIILTVCIYLIQVIWSRYWLKNYRFGPFEWAWRSLTYGKIQTMKK